MNATAVIAADPVPAAVATDLFVKVPATALPNGTLVPSFEVGKYLCSKGAKGRAAVTYEGKPWTRITYRAARKACSAAGYALITELQALALALNIAQQDDNWSGGKVGEGVLRRGLHKWSVDSAQPGTFEPSDPEEQRGFLLSNGMIIHDAAGNAYTWVFDDVQGNADGIVTKAFAADSPSITTAPFPSREKGMGWYPDAGDDWAGNALIRGGFWGSESSAGVFRLSGDWPDLEGGSVGFRCTKPIGL